MSVYSVLDTVISTLINYLIISPISQMRNLKLREVYALDDMASKWWYWVSITGSLASECHCLTRMFYCLSSMRTTLCIKYLEAQNSHFRGWIFVVFVSFKLNNLYIYCYIQINGLWTPPGHHLTKGMKFWCSKWAIR